jgi:hypothetical protein
MKKFKISMDFDGTLSRKEIKNYAKELIIEGHDVWIVTSRFATEPALANGWHWVEKQNQELYDVAEEVGIPRDKIVFTEHVDKIEYLEGKGFLFHIDDDSDELLEIVKSGDPCKVVNAEHSDWLLHCNEIINE